MLQGQQAGLIDGLQDRLPPVLKWCFAGMGAVAGLHHAQGRGGHDPLMYIVTGAVLGFCCTFLIFGALRLLKMAALLAVILLGINFMILVPFGHGDHLPGWIATAKTIGRKLSPLGWLDQWGEAEEVRPQGR